MFPGVMGASAIAINNMAYQDNIVVEDEDQRYIQSMDGPMPMRMWALHDSQYPNSSGHLEQVDRGTSHGDLRRLFADRSQVNDLRFQNEYWNISQRDTQFLKTEAEGDFQPTITDITGWRQTALPKNVHPLGNSRRVPYTLGYGENPNRYKQKK